MDNIRRSLCFLVSMAAVFLCTSVFWGAPRTGQVLAQVLEPGAGQGAVVAPGSGEPGSASDPVLTRSSLLRHLEGLFEEPRRKLSALERRLALVEQGIRAVQESFAASFPDLRGHWAERAVIALRARGIIGGYPDGRFYPERPVARAELAVMLARAKNLSPRPGEAVFSDLGPGHWAAGAIGAARAAGYLQGYPDGTFRPEKGVTRAEAAVVLNRAFSPRAGSGGSGVFRDLKGHWAAGDVAELAAAGILGGYPDGTFRPQRAMTRAELAVALARVLALE